MGVCGSRGRVLQWPKLRRGFVACVSEWSSISLRCPQSPEPQDANVRTRLVARTFSSCGHPRFVGRWRAFRATVCPAAETGVEEDITFVDEEVCGASLADVLAEGPLTLSQALVLLQELAAAVVDCHKVGVAHMDIRPENIGISDRWAEVRLQNFHVSVLRRRTPPAAHSSALAPLERRASAAGSGPLSRSKRTRDDSGDAAASGAGAGCDTASNVSSGAGHGASSVARGASPAALEHWPIVVSSLPGGTPAYLAPEVADLRTGRCSAINAAKCDIWAIGVLLFRCLYGVLPFEDLRLDDLHAEGAGMGCVSRKAAMQGDWAMFWQTQAGRGLPVTGTTRVDIALRSLIEALLAPSPADRPSSPMLALHPWIGPAIPAAAVTAARDEFRARLSRSRAR